MRVYKFRPKKWGLRALEDNELKVSPIEGLNDPFEYLAVDLGDKSVRKFIGERRKFLDNNSGVISFCKRWSNPVIWSHYAEDHQGMALGFDVPDNLLFEMQYSDDRIPFDASSIKDADALKKVMEHLGKTKFKHWKYEEEYRLLFDLNRARKKFPDGELFLQSFEDDLMLKEVILGCRYEGGKHLELEKKLIEQGVKITTSRAAFRTFTMTRQSSSKLQKRL